jgi:hypothetical protein
LRMGPIGCPEILVNNYQLALHKNSNTLWWKLDISFY